MNSPGNNYVQSIIHSSKTKRGRSEENVVGAPLPPLPTPLFTAAVTPDNRPSNYKRVQLEEVKSSQTQTTKSSSPYLSTATITPTINNNCNNVRQDDDTAPTMVRCRSRPGRPTNTKQQQQSHRASSLLVKVKTKEKANIITRSPYFNNKQNIKNQNQKAATVSSSSMIRSKSRYFIDSKAEKTFGLIHTTLGPSLIFLLSSPLHNSTTTTSNNCDININKQLPTCTFKYDNNIEESCIHPNGCDHFSTVNNDVITSKADDANSIQKLLLTSLCCSSCEPFIKDAISNFECCDIFCNKFQNSIKTHHYQKMKMIRQKRKNSIFFHRQQQQQQQQQQPFQGSKNSGHKQIIKIETGIKENDKGEEEEDFNPDDYDDNHNMFLLFRRPCWERIGNMIERSVRHLCAKCCYLHAYSPYREWYSLCDIICNNEIIIKNKHAKYSTNSDPNNNDKNKLSVEAILSGWKCYLKTHSNKEEISDDAKITIKKGQPDRQNGKEALAVIQKQKLKPKNQNMDESNINIENYDHHSTATENITAATNICTACSKNTNNILKEDAVTRINDNNRCDNNNEYNSRKRNEEETEADDSHKYDDKCINEYYSNKYLRYRTVIFVSPNGKCYPNKPQAIKEIIKNHLQQKNDKMSSHQHIQKLEKQQEQQQHQKHAGALYNNNSLLTHSAAAAASSSPISRAKRKLFRLKRSVKDDDYDDDKQQEHRPRQYNEPKHEHQHYQKQNYSQHQAQHAVGGKAKRWKEEPRVKNVHERKDYTQNMICYDETPHNNDNYILTNTYHLKQHYASISSLYSRDDVFVSYEDDKNNDDTANNNSKNQKIKPSPTPTAKTSILKSKMKNTEILQKTNKNVQNQQHIKIEKKNMDSPFGLIEELFSFSSSGSSYYNDDDDYDSIDEIPWRLLISAILLNKTTRIQGVDIVLYNFFRFWPNARSVTGDNENEDCNEYKRNYFIEEQIKKVIEPLGLRNKRSKGIIRFSKEYIDLLKLKRCNYRCTSYATTGNVGTGNNGHTAYSYSGINVGFDTNNCNNTNSMNGSTRIANIGYPNNETTALPLSSSTVVDANYKRTQTLTASFAAVSTRIASTKEQDMQDAVALEKEKLKYIAFHLSRGDILSLYHCGEYAYDAYKIFILGEIDDETCPSDRVLGMYVEYHRGLRLFQHKIEKRDDCQ